MKLSREVGLRQRGNKIGVYCRLAYVNYKIHDMVPDAYAYTPICTYNETPSYKIVYRLFRMYILSCLFPKACIYTYILCTLYLYILRVPNFRSLDDD